MCAVVKTLSRRTHSCKLAPDAEKLRSRNLTAEITISMAFLNEVRRFCKVISLAASMTLTAQDLHVKTAKIAN
jgi:hypothetical protein